MKRLVLDAAVAAFAQVAGAQQKEIKVGIIYDYAGAFAAGGSEAWRRPGAAAATR